MQDGDIFGWHLSLGVALEVTLLSDIPDMIFSSGVKSLLNRCWLYKPLIGSS